MFRCGRQQLRSNINKRLENHHGNLVFFVGSDICAHYFTNQKATSSEPVVYTCVSDNNIIICFASSNTGNITTYTVRTSGNGTVTTVLRASGGSARGIYLVTGVNTGDTISIYQTQVQSAAIYGVFAEYNTLI